MQTADVTRRTIEKSTLAIADGPILPARSWDRDKTVRHQVVGASATRQTNDGEIEKWRVTLFCQKLKKDGTFSKIGRSQVDAWDHSTLERSDVAACLTVVCDRLAIAASELYRWGDIVRETRAAAEAELEAK